MDELTTKDGVWRMDVDAFRPKPEGFIVLKGVEYPVFSFMDVSVDDSLTVARLADDLNAEDSDYPTRLERSIQQIMMLNKPGEPRLTREMFNGIPPREIIRLTVLASSIAQVPLRTAASRGESVASPSPSPASVASSAGGEETSSV